MNSIVRETYWRSKDGCANRLLTKKKTKSHSTMDFLKELKTLIDPHIPKSIKWAPINIPLKRRLQTIGAASWVFHAMIWSGIVYTFVIPLAIVLTFIFISSTLARLAIIASIVGYLTWMWVIDWNIIHQGGRSSEFVRNWRIWKWFNEYFPIKIVKTPECELDPRKNYLFCNHPHGLFCLGVFGAFATHGNADKEKLFGEFQMNILTFVQSFMFPGSREMYVALGLCAASRESMNCILGKEGGRNVAVLIPGGASEALEFVPGKYILQLKDRKGFIKVALQNGSPLVPVFSFGENVIFSQIYGKPGSRLRKFQEWFQQITNVPPVLWYGRGIFQYTFGWLPRRHPITIVVGAPINVEKVLDPSLEEIDQLHETYVEALTKLFYDYRELYSSNPNDTLVIT